MTISDTDAARVADLLTRLDHLAKQQAEADGGTVFESRLLTAADTMYAQAAAEIRRLTAARVAEIRLRAENTMRGYEAPAERGARDTLWLLDERERLLETIAALCDAINGAKPSPLAAAALARHASRQESSNG